MSDQGDAKQKRYTKDQALQFVLDSHSRRENRNIDGEGKQFLVYDTCELCEAAKSALHVKENEFEVVADSDPYKRVKPLRKRTTRRKPSARQNTARTPKAAAGDGTPAGYQGHPGPRSASAHDEAKTATLDDQSTAKPLDPRMAGPDAQRARQ